MGSRIGIQMKTGFQPQGTYGTAEAPGANDLICWHGEYTTRANKEAVPTCGSGKQFLRQISQQVGGKFTLPTVQFYGMIEHLFLLFFGTRTSDPAGNQRYTDGRGMYTEEFTLTAQPAKYATAVTQLDDAGTPADDDLIEVEGIKIKSIDLMISESGLATMDITFVANQAYNSDSSSITTAASDIDNLTYRVTVGTNVGNMDRKSVLDRIWIAPQAQATLTSSDKVCAKSMTIHMENPYEDISYVTCSDEAEPKVLDSRDVWIELELHDPTDFTWDNYYDQNDPLKLKIDLNDSFGGPGPSISDAAPSTNISAAGINADLKVTLRKYMADGTYVTDGPHTLTQADPAALDTGDKIAAAYQVLLRAVTATNSKYQDAFTSATVDHNVLTAAKYTFLPDPAVFKQYGFVITDGTVNNIADDLKVGVANSGTEPGTTPNSICFYFPHVEVAEISPISITTSGRMPSTVKLQALYRNHGALDGFKTSDDDRLESNMTGNEECRATVCKPVDTDPDGDF